MMLIIAIELDDRDYEQVRLETINEVQASIIIK